LAQSGKYGTFFKDFFINPQTLNHEPDHPMPLYEYVCRKCNNKFGEVLTIKEHETKKVCCPNCQSTELDKVIEPFFAKTARKTRGY
jgi:putative FmdB family regulatory protein